MKEEKEPKEGSEEEEAAESPEEESAEKESSSEGVKVPEEFQKECHALLKDCNDKACLSYLREAIYAKEEEFRKASESKGNKKKTPEEYSMTGAPSM